MASARTLVEQMTDYLTKDKSRVKLIRVNVTRETALRFAKPKKRGGPLYYRGRKIVTRDRSAVKSSERPND